MVRYAAENQVPSTPRGAGTDTAAGLGPGLGDRPEPPSPQDHRDRPRACGGRARRCARRAQCPARCPGASARAGSQRWRRHHCGRDDRGRCRGARSSRYGSIGDQVDRLRVVFAQGDVADLGFEPWPGFEAEPADFKDLVVRKLQHAVSKLRGQARPTRCRRSMHESRRLRPASAAERRRESTSAGWWPARRGRWRSSFRPCSRTVPHPRGAGSRSCCRSSGFPTPRRSCPSSRPGLRPVLVRPLRPPLDQPGTRRRPLVPRLDRRGGRGDPDRRIRRRRPRVGRRQGSPV